MIAITGFAAIFDDCSTRIPSAVSHFDLANTAASIDDENDTEFYGIALSRLAGRDSRLGLHDFRIQSHKRRALRHRVRPFSLTTQYGIDQTSYHFIRLQGAAREAFSK